MNVSEKLQLVEDLWDNIAATPEQISVLEWQKEELARRKAAHLQNLSASTSWEEAKDKDLQSTWLSNSASCQKQSKMLLMLTSGTRPHNGGIAGASEITLDCPG